MAEPTVAGAGSGEATGSLLPQVHALLHRLAHPAALLAWAPPALPGAEGAGGPGRPTGPGGDFAGAELRILLLRPSPLRQVSGSATHLLVQALLARHPGVFVDLAFLPEPADLPLLQRAGLSPAFGLLSGQHARAFDVVAFSNSALLELANIPYLLDRCGLLAPLGQRLADRRLPLLLLLLLGGANAPFAGVLLAGEPLIDVLFLGEREPASRPLVEALRFWGRGECTKEQALAALAGVPGCYVATHPAPVVPPRHGLDEAPPPLMRLPLLFGEQSRAAVAELSRGCPA